MPLGIAIGRWLWVIFEHDLYAVPRASNQLNADFKAGTPSALKAANADVAALAYHTITAPLGQLEEQVAAHNKSVLTASSAEAARDRVLVGALMLVALGLAGGVRLPSLFAGRVRSLAPE